MEEELYECKVEVKTRDTTVPTSVRTIESVVDVPGWAPITPYLNVSKKISTTSSEEVSSILQEHGQGQFVTAGVVTSPESVMTSTNLITTPDSSISLHSQLSTAEVRNIIVNAMCHQIFCSGCIVLLARISSQCDPSPQVTSSTVSPSTTQGLQGPDEGIIPDSPA